MNFNLAQIEVTNHCNKECEFCFRKYMTREKGFMSFKTFRASLDLCKKLNIPEIWLHNWGEPLLHNQLCDLIKLAKDFTVGFTTNGLLLTDEIITKLSKTRLAYLDISFNALIGKFRLFHLLIKYQQLNHKGIDCRFRVVVNNIKDYHYVSFLLRDCKVRWQREMKHDKRQTRWKDCEAKDKVFVILWDGTVVPCCHVINKEIVYGNIFEPFEMKLDVLNNDYCKHCLEVEDDMEVRFKL